MSSFNERLNSSTTDTYLDTGKEANSGKKIPTVDTYFIRTIPHDRHRFTRFAIYLNNFSNSLSELALESCKRDCNRKLSYIHGKNVSISEDLNNLCNSRCHNEVAQHKNTSEVKNF